MAVNYGIFEIWANLWSKFSRNYKLVIYVAVKFYGIVPSGGLHCRQVNNSELH